MKRIDVELAGYGGTILRGWLYRPSAEGSVPGVVMAHGFSATKEMALDGYATVFAEAGLCVLVYDPGVCVEYIAPTPLLMIVANEDRLAATADSRAAYERAGEPKRLVMIEGHHFSPYEGEALVRASSTARDFFIEHL
jgi:hypothetical protein